MSACLSVCLFVSLSVRETTVENGVRACSVIRVQLHNDRSPTFNLKPPDPQHLGSDATEPRTTLMAAATPQRNTRLGDAQDSRE